MSNNTLNSLTAPWDRESAKPSTVGRGTVLSEEQVQSAVSELIDTGITDKFPKVDRMYADPIYNNQMYCLHSFVPSKGATPDDHGVFGFMKIRGAFQTIDEANQRSEWLIRNVDSYHSIHTGYAGRPFPICTDTKKFVAETVQVDIKKKATEVISEDIKEKRMKEKQEIKDIKDREAKLLDESKEDFVPDPIERYTKLQVKKAHLVWTYVKTREKLLEMQPKIRNAYAEIREMDAEDESYSRDYFEKYMNARREAGIPEDHVADNFQQYLVEDAELDFDY